jgi:endonuclease/exonuclease/phosphatase family metal-dependent hydrolase
MIRQLVLIALALLPGFAGAAPLRVATFNLENYLAMDRRIEGRFRPNYPKPEREKAAIRDVIHRVHPDVLALEEMGPAPYLEELRRDLAQEGLDFPHSILLEAADPERHVAILSQLPFARVTPHGEIEFKYLGGKERVKRGLLEVAFAAPDGEWTLFVAHLKSRYTDHPEDPLSAARRLLEACAIRDLIAGRFPDPATARFLVVGDFNDTRGSKALAALRHRGKMVIAKPVPACDARGETWTFRYQLEDVYSRVDFLLASPGLWPAVIGQKGVVDDGETSLGGSDHRMVYCDLESAQPAATIASPVTTIDDEISEAISAQKEAD